MSELESFHRFLGDQRVHGESTLTPEECLELWRIQNPPDETVEADILAVREALDDMDAGDQGQPLQAFLTEFRAGKLIPS
jgi:hypothetical protein